MKTAAIILAAGFSTRMGSDKALLQLGGISALERIVMAHQAAGCSRMIVVTGQNDLPIRQLGLPVELVQNPAPESGMFSSVKLGVTALDSSVDAFFVHPVDIPLVSSETLQLLVCQLALHYDMAAAIPCFKGRGGHPPLLRISLRTQILANTGENGLRGLLSGHQLLRVVSHDKAVALDMDTPEDYATLQAVARENCL